MLIKILLLDQFFSLISFFTSYLLERKSLVTRKSVKDLCSIIRPIARVKRKAQTNIQICLKIIGLYFAHSVLHLRMLLRSMSLKR